MSWRFCLSLSIMSVVLALTGILQQPCAARATILTSSEQIQSAWLDSVRRAATYIHIAEPSSLPSEAIKPALVDAGVKRHAEVTILNGRLPEPAMAHEDQCLATAGCHIIYNPALFQSPALCERIAIFDGDTAILEIGGSSLALSPSRAVLLKNDPVQVAKIEAQWLQMVLHSVSPSNMANPIVHDIRSDSRPAMARGTGQRSSSAFPRHNLGMRYLWGFLYGMTSFVLSIKIVDFLMSAATGGGFRDLSPSVARWLEPFQGRGAFCRGCVYVCLALFRWPPLMLFQSLIIVKAPSSWAALYGIGILLVAICLAIMCAFNQFHAGQYKYTTLIPFGRPRGQPNKHMVPILPNPAATMPTQKEQVVIFIRILRGLLAATIFGYAGIYSGLVILGGFDVLHGLSSTEPLWLQTLYFSVVLTSTVGFGDIYATTAWAQIFVMTQCISSFSIVVILMAMFTSTVGTNPKP